MDDKQLLTQIAILESKLDQLETEFDFVNALLVQCGFPEGLKTLKETANEIIQEKSIKKRKSNL